MSGVHYENKTYEIINLGIHYDYKTYYKHTNLGILHEWGFKCKLQRQSTSLKTVNVRMGYKSKCLMCVLYFVQCVSYLCRMKGICKIIKHNSAKFLNIIKCRSTIVSSEGRTILYYHETSIKL